jgi:DNA-directed RNA polymerase subunit RPC12/RpoP
MLINCGLPQLHEMSSQPESDTSVIYQCVWCGKKFEKRMLSKIAETRCPYCGFNVIMKAGPPTAKLIISSKLTEEQRLLTED